MNQRAQELHLELDVPEPSLRDAPSDLRPHDDEERDGDHDHRDGDDLREVVREPERRVEVDRERLLRPDDERGDRVLVERRRERDEIRGDDGRQEQRKGDRAERPEAACSDDSGLTASSAEPRANVR